MQQNRTSRENAALERVDGVPQCRLARARCGQEFVGVDVLSNGVESTSYGSLEDKV